MTAFISSTPLLPSSHPRPRVHYRQPSHVRAPPTGPSRPSHHRRATVCTSTPAAPDGLTYATSGVDIDVESASVRALLTALKTRPPARTQGQPGALLPHPGGFSGLLEFGDSLLALCTDGVGSKLLLASSLDNYDTIAHDLVAMNVNDLLCVGAEPLAFVDYLATPAPSPTLWARLGVSLAAACADARVSLAGGETASLPDLVTHLDISGTALGSVPRGSQLTGETIAPGDVVIGLPSSGIHSNGYSLVRRIVDDTHTDLNAAPPFDITAAHADTRASPIARRADAAAEAAPTLGDVLLTPTRIYVDPVFDLLSACRSGNEAPCSYADVHGIVHVTGGGLSNLLRLNGSVGFDIANPLPVLPEFEWLKRAGGVSDFEMLRTFNMGMGMCIVVASGAADAVASWFSARLPGSRVVGRVTAERGTVRHVPTGVSFDAY